MRLTPFVSTILIGALASACGSSSMSPSAPSPTPNPSSSKVMSVNISGAPTTPESTFQLTANAMLSDGTRQDVTNAATWSSSDSQVATVLSSGRVVVMGDGNVDVHANYEGVDGAIHLQVSLPPTYTVRGLVTELTPNGSPVPGARVQIVVGPFTYTDDQGVFTLFNVPAGLTILEVTKDGYRVWSDEIVVDKDTLVLGIILQPICPGPRCGQACPGPQCKP